MEKNYLFIIQQQPTYFGMFFAMFICGLLRPCSYRSANNCILFIGSFEQTFLKYCLNSLRECNFLQNVKVSRQQARLVRLRSIQKIPAPKKLLISPFPGTINHICKKYSLEKSYDKKTSNEIGNIFQK